MEDIKYPVRITMTKAGKIYGIDFKPEVLKKFVNSEYGYTPVNFLNIPIFEYNPESSTTLLITHEDVSIRLTTKLNIFSDEEYDIVFEVSFGSIKQNCSCRCNLKNIERSISRLQEYVIVLNKDRGDLEIKEDYDDPEKAEVTDVYDNPPTWGKLINSCRERSEAVNKEILPTTISRESADKILKSDISKNIDFTKKYETSGEDIEDSDYVTLFVPVDNNSKIMKEAREVLTDKEWKLAVDNASEFATRMFELRMSKIIDKKKEFLDTLSMSE